VIPERIRPVVELTAELAERFSQSGHSLYLVGGTVRDALVGRPGAGTQEQEAPTPGAPAAGAAPEPDLDLTTDALPDVIEEILRGWAEAVWTQGKRFGTIGAVRAGRHYEVTTHRAEAYQPDSRKPDVVFGTDVEVDLSRRDFTVNAMALRLPDLQLFDPFDGLGDLAQKRLRTPLDPSVSFSDDPLRMLRAARFIAGYGLVPEEELVLAIRTMAERLSIVSVERIRDELDKLMCLSSPGDGLWFIVSTGLAARFLPELPGLALEQDPIHRHKDVLAHTIAVVAKTRPDRILRLAALFHDVGKPRTRAIGPNGVSFHHHDVVGARMTRTRMVQLHYSSADTDAVTRLVELHLRFHTYGLGWTDSAVRRYARDAGPLVQKLNELTRADCTTRNANKVKALERRMDELEERLEDLASREELDAIRPELDGTEVMELLDLRPGKEVGRVLAFLLELRLEEGLLGREEITRRLQDWWSAQSSAGKD
jgi:poly(A) polymerase